MYMDKSIEVPARVTVDLDELATVLAGALSDQQAAFMNAFTAKMIADCGGASTAAMQMLYIGQDLTEEARELWGYLSTEGGTDV